MGAVNTKFAREVVKAIEGICHDAGATVRVETGSAQGHGKIVISMNGKERWTPLSCSPRTLDQAIKYKMSDVRRILREIAA